MDFLWFPLLVVGSALLGIANETFSSIFVVISFAGLGMIICSISFRQKRYELNAFLLSFSVSVFIAGLAQFYALTTFGVVQTTSDAVHSFFANIAPAPPFTKADDIPILFNSPLAILIWQQVYALSWWVGLKSGPHLGVIVNSFTIGLVGAMIVGIARELFGSDPWRLRRLGLLTASCGLFWLFGAIFIRDCFVLFLNTVVLWVLIIWLNRPSLKTFTGVLFVVSIVSVPMTFLRVEGTVFFGVFFILAVGLWSIYGELNFGRMLALMVLLSVIVGGAGVLSQYFEIMMFMGEHSFDGYLAGGEEKSQVGSLGMSLVMNQPLPVRLVLGSGAMLLHPVPLWVAIASGASEYNLVKMFNGIFQVLIAPLVFAGFMVSYRGWVDKKSKISLPIVFLALYALAGLSSVVLTSMETRHFGQFMPAFLVLSVFPDTRVPKVKRVVRRVSVVWFACVISIHLAWLILKF